MWSQVGFAAAAAAAANSLQSCLTLCDPIDSSPPGSAVPGILQARTLEWVAISFSNAWKWKVRVKSLSHVWLLATPWTATHQAPPSMGFSRQECWSGLPLPSLKHEALKDQCFGGTEWLDVSCGCPFLMISFFPLSDMTFAMYLWACESVSRSVMSDSLRPYRV